MGKLEFKEFVKSNPTLYKFVKNKEMTWQQFYEMFDIYGSDNDIWNQYLKNDEIKKEVESSAVGGTLAEFINWFKSMNLDEIQDGLNSVGRVISVLQDFGTSKETKTDSTYKPRPIYKHFED